jgi:hypothetical protein
MAGSQVLHATLSQRLEIDDFNFRLIDLERDAPVLGDEQAPSTFPRRSSGGLSREARTAARQKSTRNTRNILVSV